MNDRVDRRKQRELFLLQRFIVAAKLSVEGIEEREAPDFIIDVEGRTVGLEITELFISHDERGSTMQAQESISSRIISSAQRLYENSGAPPAHINVCFGPEHDLRKLNRDETARALATFVQRQNLCAWQHLDWHPEDSEESLPEQISSIRALGVPNPDMAHWGVVRAGWVAPLQAPPLQSRVDEKAKRLPRYRESIAENWLVIVVDATSPSQLIRVKDDFNPRSVNSPFAHSFFYSYPDDVVVELGVKSPTMTLQPKGSETFEKPK